MAKTKISPAEWAAARLRWETEPPCTYADLTASLGLSKQAIAKRANKDGWSKQLDMARVVEMAHQKADRNSTAPNAENSPLLSPQRPMVVGPEVSKTHLDANPESRHESEKAAAVAARAVVLQRHRTEWVAARNLLYLAIKTKEPETIKAAKAAAEAMKKIQEGERDAWDLVANSGTPKLQIIIERNAGVRVVR